MSVDRGGLSAAWESVVLVGAIAYVAGAVVLLAGSVAASEIQHAVSAMRAAVRGYGGES